MTPTTPISIIVRSVIIGSIDSLLVTIISTHTGTARRRRQPMAATLGDRAQRLHSHGLEELLHQLLPSGAPGCVMTTELSSRLKLLPRDLTIIMPSEATWLSCIMCAITT